jgi:hypothetical protein
LLIARFSTAVDIHLIQPQRNKGEYIMATLMNKQKMQVFHLVHPLDDMPEEKRSPEGLGSMHMSLSVRISLMALRGYLILMALLVLYSILQQSGILGH